MPKVKIGDLEKNHAYSNIDLEDDELRQLINHVYAITKQDPDALMELNMAMMQGLDHVAGKRFQAYGMTKGSLTFQLTSMIKFVTQGVPAAPLELSPEEKRAGSAMRTAGGTVQWTLPRAGMVNLSS